MGILLCEQNFRNVWIRNESVRAEIGQILHTDTHTTAAKLVVRMNILWGKFSETNATFRPASTQILPQSKYILYYLIFGEMGI